MKVVNIEGSTDRHILTGMILDPIVLGRIASKWADPGLFASDMANLIGGWCVWFYRKRGKAPGKNIVSLFRLWATKHKESDMIESVDQFLTGLQQENIKRQELNSDHLIDMAATKFSQVKMSQVNQKIADLLAAGEIQKAKMEFQTFQDFELGSNGARDLFLDKEAVKSYFTDREESLIEYPGDAGKFFGNQLARDSFVSFIAPEKTGKTFWLLDMAFMAMIQRKRVAFFEVGDMSERQIARRFLLRAAKRPFRRGTIPYPDKITFNQASDEFALVTHRNKTWETDLDFKTAWEACERVMATKVRSTNSYLKLSCHSNSSINVAGIRSIIDSWILDGFVPDVVICDYADILDSPAGRSMEVRDQINTTWKQLRAMSQDYHCLVVTATQADAASYEKKVLDRRNFSEDKRKISHVTSLIGINVTATEKERGVMRLNPIAIREEDYSTRRCLHVAPCLAIANPCVLSTF